MGNISSESVITRLKNIFARFGVPATLITDNGRQFTSTDFESFSKTWNFSHVTSSPHYPQSNGAAERAVRTAKGILSQEDPQLALLIYRSTPIPELGASPAEMALGRRIRTNLPTIPRQLDMPVVDEQQLRKLDSAFKKKQKLNHDRHRGAKSLPDLKPGDPVMIKLDGEKSWLKPGRVRETCAPRSYIIDTDKGCLRRNRRHLQSRPEDQTYDFGNGAARNAVGPNKDQTPEAARPAVGPKDDVIPKAARQAVGPKDDVVPEAACPPVDDDASTHLEPEPEPDPEPRRSGRKTRLPAHMKDYDLTI